MQGTYQAWPSLRGRCDGEEGEEGRSIETVGYGHGRAEERQKKQQDNKDN